MSLAPDFELSVPIPARARPQSGDGPAGRLASVTVLRPPGDTETIPLRLTRRGVLVASVAVAALGAALIWVAALSAPAEVAAPAPGPAVVTVAPGDTMWSIATRVAPERDPRAEVAHLQRLNGGSGVELVPGERLRVH